MKNILLVMFLFIFSGCTLHQKSELTTEQIKNKINSQLDKAYDFALKSEKEALVNGRKLTQNELNYAKSMGIKYPEKIRVSYQYSFPMPKDEELLKEFKSLGMDSLFVAGITYRYGIFIKPYFPYKDNILAHELVHVKQIESEEYKQFLYKYFIQAFSYEYFDMPYEKEAFEHDYTGFDK